MKTQEQRVRDLTAELRRTGCFPFHPGDKLTELAKRMLEAVDKETSAWPSDPVLAAAYRWWGDKVITEGAAELDKEDLRKILREAMLQDPIIKAAIEYEKQWAPTMLVPGAYKIVQAVRNAGLR